MAETLLLPLVRAAAGKTADALVQRVTSMCGVDGDRHKLERQLLAVQYKLADAEMKSETNQYIKMWMKDFRTVAYEANDVLDDFQYEALRCEAQIGKSKTRKVLSHFTSHSPLLFRLTMSRKLSNVLKKINELVEEMNKFGLVECTEPPELLYRQTHSALDDSADIFGRDDDKELLVNLLLRQRDESKVQILPIFGMGGLGKTTLAKMVYNDGRIQQHFQVNMWHCVSENFEAIDLVKSFIELATRTECNLPNTIELLRVRLQEVIGHKRYLLVLDDVWNEEKRKWEDGLKPLLYSLGGPGSVILVTCRSRQVASIMSTLKPHELACLSEDDSWELFSRKAFCNGVVEQPELVSIGRGIVKKCRGLPLALKTIGGLMSSKQQVHEWKAIEERSIGDNACIKDEIISVLKLSYRHLSSEMKQCFAFCSVYGKDSKMEKDMLIQLWIANGFIQEEGTMDLSQKGELIFHYLVWRSFLQDVKEKEVTFGMTRRTEICCKMHDLMHDLAKDVTDECATIQDLVQQRASIKDTRHMQIITRTEVEQSNRLLRGTPYLHTFLEPCTPNKNLKKLRLMSLRALDVYVPSTIHSHVLNAKHLRYLDLSKSDIVRLPDSVCVLYNLQTLRLNDCRKLQLLPEYMSAMRNLIHIYLLGCDCLERMPQKFSLLKNLHTLTTFVVDNGDGHGINELKDLQHLANRLELYNLRKVKSVKSAKEANLHQKQNIRELSLYWGRSKDEKSEHEACRGEQVLDCLAPHSNLQILKVAGYHGLKVSQWMRDPQMFQCLRKLVISNCPRCKDLPVVWLLVSLEDLLLEKLSSLTTLGRITEVEAEGYNTHLQIFPKLKEMALYDLPSLDRWMENSAGDPMNSTVFPMIEVLHIRNCPKIASVPGSPVLKHLCIAGLCCPPISSLAHLTTLSELKYHGNDTVSTSIPMHSWPCLEKLEVCSLANMMMVPMPLEDQQNRSQTRALETLRSLKLYGPDCFVSSSRLHLGYWECFAFVEELVIFSSSELVLWPMEELRNLAHLRSLSIYACANLEGKVSSPDETFPLPRLERLDIRNCHSLLEVPKLPTSLEQLKIFDCEKMVALPSNLGDLVKMRNLDIGVCRCLKVLPDGMDRLTCLEQLSITRCPGIEKFPQGLHDRLHALGTLIIHYCPELERRCREGGEYFHSVSSIPQKSIRSTFTESRNKNFLRRLVPSCAGSN